MNWIAIKELDEFQRKQNSVNLDHVTSVDFYKGMTSRKIKYFAIGFYQSNKNIVTWHIEDEDLYNKIVKNLTDILKIKFIDSDNKAIKL